MNMQKKQTMGVTLKTIPMVAMGMLLISEPATAKQLKQPLLISNKVLQLAMLPNFSENWNPSQVAFPSLSEEQITTTTETEFTIASNHQIHNLDGEKLPSNPLLLKLSSLIASEPPGQNRDSIPIPISQPLIDDRNVANPVLIPTSVDPTQDSSDDQNNAIAIPVKPAPIKSFTHLRSSSNTQPDRIIINFSRKVHRVQRGETINSIALSYGITREQLMRANHLSNPHLIKVDQALMIPVATQKIPDKPTLISVVPQEETNIAPNFTEVEEQQANQTIIPSNAELNSDDSSASSQPQLMSSIPINVEYYNPMVQPSPGEMVSPDLPPLYSPDQYLPDENSNFSFSGYIWPTKGVLTSGYGWRWGRMHKGIDIAGPIGTPIVAAAEGEVISAGWSSGGYGNLVKLKHYDGSVTLYAHNSKIYVRRGQKVIKGQQIAAMGNSGYSTGPHLHFEIHPQGDRAANPMAYLPRK